MKKSPGPKIIKALTELRDAIKAGRLGELKTRIYAIPARRPGETDEELAKRCVLLKDIAEPRPKPRRRRTPR